MTDTAPGDERRVTVAQAIDAALQLKGQRRLGEAEQLLRRALQAQPNNPRALRGLAEVLGQTRRPGQALACWDALLKAAPADPEALHERGLVLMGLGRPRDALASFEQALAGRPAMAAAHHNRAVALSVLGRHAEALKSYERTLELDPGHAAAWNNRGVALQELRRPELALESFEKALELKADYGAALGNRGAALREVGRPAEALASCEAALQLEPDDLSALNNKGAALHELHRLVESEAVYRRVLELQPGHVTTLNNLGNVLGEMGRAEEALAAYDQALQINPRAASTYDNKGLLLNELGRPDEAAEVIGEAIRVAPRRVRAYYNLTSAKTFSAGDPTIAVMEELAADLGALTLTDRVEIAYALAKAYADLGEHDRAFGRYQEGAALKRQQMGYDEALELKLMDRTIQAFSAEAMWRGQGVGDPSEAPVFILGMPRSGTTLVEQILASHPRVFAAGEIGDLGEVMAEMRSPARQQVRFPEGYAALHGPALRRAGGAYMERLRAMAPDAPRITNKAPGNFRFIGFIHLALPKAKVIHVRRDPIDTCLSCFTKLFARDHPYSYDLGDLGRYYRVYEAVMAHWREVIPEGVMLEVLYEDVVSDLEAQARRIVRHCGLEWDPACLDFHKAERQVRTASVTQVRQPLYATAVGRWKTYETHLGPLIEALRG
jgi:tetratricopeptide (TPR) repeat protein